VSALLQIKGLSRLFTAGDEVVTALGGIDLSIEAGEMVAIVGTSGSGKSTLMNILGCLDQPSSGSYTVAGRETAGLLPDELAQLRREHFGFIFQRYHLMGDLSAVANVETPAVYAGIGPQQRRARATALLIRLGLGDRLHHRPSQLSGGQQQRVSIARALMNGGEIILADEPTGALDSKSGETVMSILKELHADGHTIIMVTHDMAVAEHADRIVEIMDGHIIADRRQPHARPADAARSLRQDEVIGVWQSLQRRIAEAFPMALRAMAAHRTRTALTMLGIVIGIAAVVAVVGIGEGSQRRVLQQISELGASTISIYPGKDWGDESAASIVTLVPADLVALSSQPYVDSVTPEVSTSGRVRFDNISVNATILGVGQDYFRVNARRLAVGRGFDAEAVATSRQQAVLDANAAHTLFPNQQDPTGQVIMVAGVPVTVIGVEVASRSSTGGMQVYLPYTSVQVRIVGARQLQGITVRVSDSVDTAAAERSIINLLTLRHGQKDFFIFNSDQMRKTIQGTSRTMALLISSVAVIALIVGGIGVMNIMLVSVSERTREIGLRMAVGARRGDIMLQFLIEAVTVCIAGAIVGVGLALLVGATFGQADGEFPMVFSASSIALACVTALLIGLSFGFLPARSAAHLNPVDALSRE
jgi:macrolide transport system ATP-binding/permease protein